MTFNTLANCAYNLLDVKKFKKNFKKCLKLLAFVHHLCFC